MENSSLECLARQNSSDNNFNKEGAVLFNCRESVKFHLLNACEFRVHGSKHCSQLPQFTFTFIEFAIEHVQLFIVFLQRHPE